MPKLVTVKLIVVDMDGYPMVGFPLVRGPKNGRMASEAYTDKKGICEFQASPNREIVIKLLSPDNTFNEIFYCTSGDNLKNVKITLKRSKFKYISKTKIIWFSKHSKKNIPHTTFKLKYLNREAIFKTENGEKDIKSIVGEIVELTYVFPDGKRLSQTIYYLAKRINPNPLIITVDNYINDANTKEDKPTESSPINTDTNDCTAKFHKVSKIILTHEGGYINDPKDKGGATNKGIAWKTWKSFAQVDLGLAPTLDNLKKITEDQAEIIYRKRYWEPKGFCLIKDDRVGLMVYDWTITSGGAAKQVQKLLVNTYGQNITIDGGMGPQTIQALNAVADQDELLKAITKIRKSYYTALAYDSKGNPKDNLKFLKGWLNRVNNCLKVKL